MTRSRFSRDESDPERWQQEPGWQEAHDAWEPTYPDGSVRHECWDSRSLRKAAPVKPASQPEHRIPVNPDDASGSAH